MATTTSNALSKKDSAILSALFDPEASLQPVLVLDAPKSSIEKSTLILEIENSEREALLSINEAKPSDDRIRECVAKLSRIIAAYPTYASAWNNRAQATRLLFDIAEAVDHAGEMQSVYTDLTTAIRLATPNASHEMVTPPATAVLASAHTHRGFILWYASRPEADEHLLKAVEELNGLDKSGLEQLANKDFSLGGRYGNPTARQLAIKTNPYAKLCGSIVREAMQKEILEYRQSVL